MQIHDVHQGILPRKSRKRIGRGIGSGHGKTATKGHKGQRSRTGHSQHVTFQGGMTSTIAKIPKRGFNNEFALDVAIINLDDLDARFEAGDEITPEILRERGIVKGRYDVLKILGSGELSKKLTISAHRFSASAKQKIEAAGGSITELVHRISVEDKKAAAKQSGGGVTKRKRAAKAGSPKKSSSE